MVPASQLRVYEPLESFTESQQRRWARYIESDVPLPTSTPYRQAACQGPGEGGNFGFVYPDAGEHAFVRRVNGSWLVCPWGARVGILRGILDFRGAAPADLANVLVPETEAVRASNELARLRSENPGVRDNVVSAAWHVPLRWLAAFDDSERILTVERRSAAPGPDLGPDLGPERRAGERGAVRLRYETDLAVGVARLRRARDILDEAGLDDSIVSPVAELADWMDGFDPDSTLELDYWGLADLIPVEDLETDRSAGEIWACLEAMELGDLEESRRRYSALASWWELVRSVERTN